jgi:hypothetical protein
MKELQIKVIYLLWFRKHNSLKKIKIVPFFFLNTAQEFQLSRPLRLKKSTGLKKPVGEPPTSQSKRSTFL